jgi:hypothetical protein
MSKPIKPKKPIKSGSEVLSLFDQPPQQQQEQREMPRRGSGMSASGGGDPFAAASGGYSTQPKPQTGYSSGQSKPATNPFGTAPANDPFGTLGVMGNKKK